MENLQELLYGKSKIHFIYKNVETNTLLNNNKKFKIFF